MLSKVFISPCISIKALIMKGLVSHRMSVVCLLTLLSPEITSCYLQRCLTDVKQLFFDFWNKDLLSNCHLAWCRSRGPDGKQWSKHYSAVCRTELFLSFTLVVPFCGRDVAGNHGNEVVFHLFSDRWFKRAGFLSRRQTSLMTRSFSVRKQVILL